MIKVLIDIFVILVWTNYLINIGYKIYDVLNIFEFFTYGLICFIVICCYISIVFIVDFKNFYKK